MLWASFLAGMLSACTVYAQECMYIIQLDISDSVEYALYTDQEGKTPLLDDAQQPVTVQTDECGSAFVELNEKELYLKQTSAPDGYYFDDTVHHLEEVTALFMQPITVSFTSDVYPVTFQLTDEEENVIAQWKADEESYAMKDDECISFQAGKKYKLIDIAQDESCITEPFEFEIPHSKQEETIQIAYSHITSGIFQIHVEDEEGNPVKNATYQLFDDEACTKASFDADGKEAILQTDEEGFSTKDLIEGSYYLKQMEIDESYYRNEKIQKIEVKQSETASIKEICKQIQWKVMLVDAESGSEIDGKVHFQSEKETFDAASSNTISLKRGISYEISDLEHPSGYYPVETMQYLVPETEPSEELITLYYVPYFVHFSLASQDTGEIVNGGEYQILDTNGEEVLSFEMSENGFVTSSLQEGNTYILHQTKTLDGFTSIEDISFSIPASYSEGRKHIIEVNTETTPFVYVHMAILDQEKGKIDEGMISLYTDASCTNQAVDLEGNVLSFLKTDADFKLKTGTYYAKVSDLNAQYYLLEDVNQYDLTHDEGIEKTITFQAKHVQANIQIVDQQDQPLIGATIEVLDANQEVIHTFTSTEDNTSELSNVLERGEEYYLRVEQLDGSYTYDSEDLKVSIPLVQPEEELTSKIVCTPYVSLKISQQDHYGNTIALYEDEECLVLAKDITGAYTKKTMSEDDSISWLLRDGTYYLKETEASEGCYLTNDVQKIVIDSSSSFSQEITHKSSPVALQLSIVTENGKALSGAKYEIQDQKGNTITTISNFQDLLTGDWLQPNQTYIIHEVEAPKGYQSSQMDIVYTVPETEPNEVPSVEISYGKNTKPKVQLNTSDKTEENEDDFDLKWMLIPIGVIILAAGIVVFKKRKDRTE